MCQFIAFIRTNLSQCHIVTSVHLIYLYAAQLLEMRDMFILRAVTFISVTTATNPPVHLTKTQSEKGNNNHEIKFNKQTLTTKA